MTTADRPTPPHTGLPAEVLHRLLRDYAAARWPNADPDHEATNLAADPVYGGDPELVTLAVAAYAAGRASVLDGATEEWGVGLPDEILEAPYVDEAHARRRAGSIAPVVHRHVTPWESVDEVKP